MSEAPDISLHPTVTPRFGVQMTVVPTLAHPTNSRCHLKVKRIVANVECSAPDAAASFYGDILGLQLVMDHGWFQTYGSGEEMTVQVGFGSEGGSGTQVPALSIEVDDVGEALARFRFANVAIEYGPVDEPWGVRRFHVRDPFDRLVNVLQHL